METWHIFITIGIIAFITEIFTPGFVFGSIGVGAIFFSVGSYFELELKWQISSFTFGVALTFFLIRPLMAKYGYGKDKIKTNQDALIDKIGIVTEEINQLCNTGRISIDGDDWKVKTSSNETVETGKKVKVVAIDSIILIVEPLN